MGLIITINRQFGSGGRELGKRLAEDLGIAYYDNEIISQLSKRSGLAVDYVNSIVEHKPIVYYPITIGRSFLSTSPAPVDMNEGLYKEQHALIKELAQGSDCVIIGRCADYILEDEKPFRIFVYADMESKIARCKSKADGLEKMTDRQLVRHINEIDRERSKYYRYFAGRRWDDPAHYDLCINTSKINIKNLAKGLCASLEIYKS